MPSFDQLIQNLMAKPAKYPTSQEIMAKPIKHKTTTISAVKTWKQEFYRGWGDKDTSNKLNALYALITHLSQLYNKPVCIIFGHEYHYTPVTSTIMFNERNPSIISALHEFAHHLKGPSEDTACKWSVWLFKKVFPASFAKLQFAPNSHMLCRAS